MFSCVRSTRRLVRGGCAVLGVLTALAPVGSAMGYYSSGGESAYIMSVPEAYELSGLVASPTYPNWYWTHSDVWKSTDVFAACAGLSGSTLAECQQTQRSRIWAVKLDPATKAVTDFRSFALSDPAWALDPVIAQNNDWEDIAIGPPRKNADGTTGVNLILAATGTAVQNPVYDGNGQDITCSTRRLIELQEPDLSDATATTWRPWKIYDIKNIVGLGGVRSCNVESLMVSTDAAGQPTAYMVTKTLRKLFSRSLDPATGRDPSTPPADVGSSLAYRPTVTYLGEVKDATGLKINAGDSTGGNVSLLVPKTRNHPCQVLTWPITSGGLGTTLTDTSPATGFVDCTAMAEGLAYVPTLGNPATSTTDLMMVADNNSSTRSKTPYWFLRDIK